MKHFFSRSLVIMALCLLAACSQTSKLETLLEAVPEECDAVAVADVKTLIESAGGSIDGGRIKLPGFVHDQLSSSEDEKLNSALDFLKNAGIDLDVAAYTQTYRDNYPIFIFLIDDSKKLINALEDEGFRDKGEAGTAPLYAKKTYESSYSSDYDDYTYVAVGGKYAYMIPNVWIGSEFRPARAIERLIDNAADASFGKTEFAKAISDGSAMGMSLKVPREARQELRQAGVPSEMLDALGGRICLNGSIDGSRATVKLRWFDEEGKSINLQALGGKMDLNAKISAEALKYMGKDEVFVVAATIKGIDWDNVTDMASAAGGLSRSDRAMLSTVKDYLQRIDGTAAFGFGVTNGFESFVNLSRGHDEMAQAAYTMVIETREGKAKSMMNDIKSLLDMADMPYDSTSKGFRIDLSNDATLYAEAVDNMIVISSSKISKRDDSPAVKSIDFSRYPMAMALALPRDSRLMRDLNLKYDIKAAIVSQYDPFELTASLSIKGGKDEGLLAQAFDVIRHLADYDVSEHYPEVEEIVEEVVEPAYVYEDSAAYVYADTVVAAY